LSAAFLAYEQMRASLAFRGLPPLTESFDEWLEDVTQLDIYAGPLPLRVRSPRPGELVAHITRRTPRRSLPVFLN
jgi:hypothetical protein